MITRRELMVSGLSSAAGSFASPLARAQAPDCGEVLAHPAWPYLSSAEGQLPVPWLSDNQTSCALGDVNGDGRIDIVLTGRRSQKAAIWLRNTGNPADAHHGWEQFVLDPGPLNPEAGSVLFDVDGDGHLDLICGGDFTSNEIWWWENPYPHYDPQVPWKRRVIKASGETQHHDLLCGDVLNEGKPQLVFWNQGAKALFLARIPDHPRDRTAPWEYHLIFQADAAMEGLAMADIDGDGRVEIVGGGRWFKHESEMQFSAHVIDDRQRFSRAGAGKFIQSSTGAQVVFANGDGCGELNWYERHADGSWTPHNLLGQDLVHGHTLRVADIDGDGRLDIFCAEMAKWCDWTRTVDYPRTHLWVFYGDGHGRFTKSVVAVGGHGTHEAQLGDINGNGRLDIVGKPYMAGAPGLDIWMNPGRK
jgi:FG-GAP-like repeat